MPPKRSHDMFVNMTEVDMERKQANKKLRAESKRASPSEATPVVSSSTIYWDRLAISTTQAEQLEQIYQNKTDITDIQFTADDSSQTASPTLMADLRLDTSSRTALGNKWAVVWVLQPTEKVARSTKRVLYQCTCGYDHASKRAQAQRGCSVPFTGCLAHVEVTYSPDDARVFRVRGYLNHNDACEQAVFERMPAIPLHPSVIDEAVRQRFLGATITDIMDRNQQMLVARAYKDQPPLDELQRSPFRWVLLQTDMKQVYRKETLQRGVNIRTKAQYNIDDWLDPDSPKFNPVFRDALFHYQRRAERNERFEACIATEEMKNAAWEYCHTKQMILDGTFGVCDRKMLLFIAMGIDSNRKGVPVAFFFFSAPTGNQQTSAGYNTDVLTRLLSKWRTSLEEHRGGQKFEPAVAITDTDLRERAALINVWEKILLIICKFHLRQSWRNYRNKTLKGRSPALATLRGRICSLEVNLIDTTSHRDAMDLLAAEHAYLDRVHDTAAAAKARSVLTYLESYWMKEDLWQSWSKFGRARAAQVLKCDLLEVLPTTNHLESFNGILKRKHLRKYQHGGKRLRLDLLLLLLVTDIIPSIFQRRSLLSLQRSAVDAQIALLPGGRELLVARDAKPACSEPVAFLVPDRERDAAARGLVKNLHNVVNTPTGVDMRCYSTEATAANALAYSLRVGFDSTARCSCPDFSQRGGACKHLRAALIALDMYRTGQSGHAPVALPPTPLPASEKAARASAAQRTAPVHPGVPIHESTLLADQPPPPPPSDFDFYEPAGDLDSDDDEHDGPDDLESVATDADSHSGSDGVDIVDTTPNPSIAALNAQTCARVARNLKSYAPRFGDLNEWLSNVQSFTADELPTVCSAIGQLEQLLGHLRRWEGQHGAARLPLPAETSSTAASRAQTFVPDADRDRRANTAAAAAAPIPPPEPARPHRKKQERPRLLSASPERKQVRKDSYGVD